VDGEVAAQVEGPLLPALEVPDHDLEVAAVAAVRRVGEQRAVARGDRSPVVEARVDDERLLLPVLAEHVELRPLVAALVDEQQDASVREEQAVGRLRQVGQLPELPSPGRDDEELAGAGDVGGEQQRRVVGRERERPRQT
jgi:hypothetical protein